VHFTQHPDEFKPVGDIRRQAMHALLRTLNHGKGSPLSADRFKPGRMYSDRIHVATLLRLRVYLTHSGFVDEGEDAATYTPSGDMVTPPWRL
jgi:hypothetical protein